MKKINKNMKLVDILDGICELEAYEEHLEDTLKNKWNPDVRSKAKTELANTRRQMTKLKNLLNDRLQNST